MDRPLLTMRTTAFRHRPPRTESEDHQDLLQAVREMPSQIFFEYLRQRQREKTGRDIPEYERDVASLIARDMQLSLYRADLLAKQQVRNAQGDLNYWSYPEAPGLEYSDFERMP